MAKRLLWIPQMRPPYISSILQHYNHKYNNSNWEIRPSTVQHTSPKYQIQRYTLNMLKVNLNQNDTKYWKYVALVQKTTAKVESEAGTAVWHKLPCDTKRWGQLVCHHRQHLSNGGWRSKRPPDGCFGRIRGGRLSMTTYLLCRRNCWKRQRTPPSLQRKMPSYQQREGAQGNVLVFFAILLFWKMSSIRQCQHDVSAWGKEGPSWWCFWWKPFSCFDKQLVQPKIILKLRRTNNFVKT